MPNAVDLYDNVYGDFDSRAETDVRARAFGEDIGAERRLSRYAYLAQKPARNAARDRMNAFAHVITSLDELRSLIDDPPPQSRSLLKERPTLDPHSRAFIAHSPFLLLGTAGADGRCDVSPRGDAPGFVQVLDDRRLAIPDRPGNRRLDSLQNLLTNPHVGLLFLIPGRDDTLRVNGRAWMTRDPEILQRAVVQGKAPLLAIGVEVEQCFFHCAKALLRSRLWRHQDWPARDVLPSYACMVFDQVQPAGLTLQDYEREIADGNATRLY